MQGYQLPQIGNTPLVRVNCPNSDCNIYVKTEGLNPFGSIKDRVALEIIVDAQKRGVLAPNGTIIEATSGNTGIGLAAVGVPLGHRVIIVMPDSMSPERIELMRGYGAEVVLTDGQLGMSGAIAEAERLHRQIKGSFIADQFNNPANVYAHYKTTGPEICKQLPQRADVFVAGVGTGGTLTGTGKFLKEQYPNIKIVAVQPKSSPVLSGGKAGSHGIQGIGANFVPKILDTDIIDEIVSVSDTDAVNACKALYKTENILAGISSGAAMVAAFELAKRPENKGKTIVVILPDTGNRYISMGLFETEV